jgi:hypothetical protein
LLDAGGYMFKEIDVIGITLVMLAKDHESKTEVIAQYSIALRFKHKLNGLRDLSCKYNYQWDFCPVSDWTIVEEKKSFLN